MKVHLHQIPEEGLHIEGEESADLLELTAKDDAKPVGPVTYSLDLGQNADGLWATGEVGVDLELTCVRCLERFIYPLLVEDMAMQVERPTTETVDLTPQVREDILLALPAYPHCDWSGERVCPGQQSTAQSRPEADESAAPRLPSAWEGLDQIKL